ncbi:hypothetical protein AS034_05460 [[Bacillus] enclensis]|nr:hypothetical protein AS034_05460 [[Bacillus] enclensis]
MGETCPAPAERLEVISQESQKAPFRLARLMLVASGRAACAFLFVQLQGLEAQVISQLAQEGKERLRGRFALCHPPLTKALPLF